MRATTPRPLFQTSRVLAFLACASAPAAGCDDETGAREPLGRAAATAAAGASAAEADLAAPASEPVAAASPVCPAGHVIALRTASGACHATLPGEAGVWSGASLLAGEQLGDDVPDTLARYCDFTWASPTSAPPDPSAFAGKPYTAIRSDCEVDWPQGQLLDDVLRPALRDAFYTHLGRLDAAALPPAPTAPVTIALADTASQANVDMNSDHAETMWRIIHAIACPPGATCPLTVSRHLALPLLADGQIDPVHGGFYGSQGQLARAIVSAVESWRSAPGSPPLILNLSVGWQPGDFGGLEAPATMPAPARAVFQSLQYAVCHGALVVAAAGNTDGDRCDDGPLAPAVWEDRPGPSAAACAAMFGPGVAPPADIAVQPLVHAVGGLGHDDAPLQNARPGGRSRLAAPAFMASADAPGGPTTPLTGSSVAAAALTGTAGLYWAYHPHLTPGQVIARLYAKAAPLAAEADFGVGGEVRRVSVCDALTSGCGGATCPTVACPATTVDTAALAAVADAALLDLLDSVELVDASLTGEVSECPARCEVADVFTPADFDGDPCEQDLVGGVDRYTDPQPDWPTCSICFLADDAVYIELDEDVASSDLTQVMLEVSDGASIHRHLLGAPELKPGTLTQLDLEQTLAAPLRATLHLTFVDGTTHSNAIAVL